MNHTVTTKLKSGEKNQHTFTFNTQEFTSAKAALAFASEQNGANVVYSHVNRDCDGERVFEDVVYNVKPFILLNDGTNFDDQCVLSSGTFEEMVKAHDFYYNNSKNVLLEVRKHDLYLNDNTKVNDIKEEVLKTTHTIKAESFTNKDGDCVSVRVRVFDMAGNTIEDSTYSEEVYLID